MRRTRSLYELTPPRSPAGSGGLFLLVELRLYEYFVRCVNWNSEGALLTLPPPRRISRPLAPRG
eukprot:scaffold41666_cov39-Phaeocystis_antarctica.AAC.3